MISDDDPHLIFCCDLGKEYWYWAKFKVGLKSHKHYIYIYIKNIDFKIDCRSIGIEVHVSLIILFIVKKSR